MATTKRRSIVEFEKWLDGEITATEKVAEGLKRDFDKVLSEQTKTAQRLKILQSVKDKLAPVTADNEDEPVLALGPNGAASSDEV